MPIKLTGLNDGKILEVTASGKLTDKDYQRFVPEFELRVRQHGKIRVLFELSGFQGWDAKAAWDDFKFGLNHFRDIERLGLVGEKQWHRWMAGFCKPFTQAQVRYFNRTEAAEARAWVEDDVDKTENPRGVKSTACISPAAQGQKPKTS